MGTDQGQSLSRRTVIAGAASMLGRIALLLACSGLFIQGHVEALLRDLTARSLGKATAEDVQNLAQRHKRFLVSHDCHGDA
jgi:hypothetical protein